MAYLREDVRTAAEHVVHVDLSASSQTTGIVGAGLVALDASGQVSTPFNTAGMFRGWVTPEGRAFVATHQDVHEVQL